MRKLPEWRQPLSWQDIPFSERPKRHPSPERLEIEKLKERVAELEAQVEGLTAERDALAKALERIHMGNYDGLEVTPLNANECRSVARAALKGKNNE